MKPANHACHGEQRGLPVSIRQIRASRGPIPYGVGPIYRPPTDQVPQPTLPASVSSLPWRSQQVKAHHKQERAVKSRAHRRMVRNNTRDWQRILRRIQRRTSRRKNTSRSGTTLRNSLLDSIRHDSLLLDRTHHNTLRGIHPCVLRGCHRALHARFWPTMPSRGTR